MFHLSEFNEMFVKMLIVYCDQNNSYEITMNGYQARKIIEIRENIEIRNVIFSLQLWEFFLSVKGELRMCTKLST